MGIDFGHFALELGMVFEGITCTGVYERVFSFQFQINKKERAICKFEMAFKKSLLLLF